jgi:hypothetical protein
MTPARCSRSSASQVEAAPPVCEGCDPPRTSPKNGEIIDHVRIRDVTSGLPYVIRNPREKVDHLALARSSPADWDQDIERAFGHGEMLLNKLVT